MVLVDPGDCRGTLAWGGRVARWPGGPHLVSGSSAWRRLVSGRWSEVAFALGPQILSELWEGKSWLSLFRTAGVRLGLGPSVCRFCLLLLLFVLWGSFFFPFGAYPIALNFPSSFYPQG